MKGSLIPLMAQFLEFKLLPVKTLLILKIVNPFTKMESTTYKTPYTTPLVVERGKHKSRGRRATRKRLVAKGKVIKREKRVIKK